MKKLLSLLLLFCLVSVVSDARAPRASTVHPVIVPKEAYVYICISSSSYAYHSNRDCRGLNRCTHEIRKVTLEDAKDKYSKKPCKICY